MPAACATRDTGATSPIREKCSSRSRICVVTSATIAPSLSRRVRGDRPICRRTRCSPSPRAGAAAGCTEALFTLGDKPELRYRAAQDALALLGHETTIDYLQAMCALVLRETGLLPHANPGLMNSQEIEALRAVTASQGVMLESLSARLCEPGGVHYGSPDKQPEARLEMLRLAGELRTPFTTGILIGIGETRSERLEALFAIRDLHRRFGHVQEVIVQNFRAKPGTRRAEAAEPDLDDLLLEPCGGARDPRTGDEHPGRLRTCRRRSIPG